jgi:hypothetical protein
MDDFINKNKNLSWTLPKTNLTNPIEFTEWLVRQESVGWIRLDLKIDIDQWKKEAAIIEQFYVDHRNHQGHVGWQGCAIHGTAHTQTETSDSDEFNQVLSYIIQDILIKAMNAHEDRNRNTSESAT